MDGRSEVRSSGSNKNIQLSKTEWASALTCKDSIKKRYQPKKQATNAQSEVSSPSPTLAHSSSHCSIQTMKKKDEKEPKLSRAVLLLPYSSIYLILALALTLTLTRTSPKQKYKSKNKTHISEFRFGSQNPSPIPRELIIKHVLCGESNKDLHFHSHRAGGSGSRIGVWSLAP